MEIAYFPTHLRFSAWLIGIITGYIFFMTRNRFIRIPKVLPHIFKKVIINNSVKKSQFVQVFNVFALILSLALMIAVVLTNYPLLQIDSEATPLQYGLYDALSRIAWSIALCYIIFACIRNSGGPINWFLSHPLWQPISRLSYSIYLTHIFIIWITMATTKTSLYFSEWIAVCAIVRIYFWLDLNSSKIFFFYSQYHAFLGNYVLTVFVSILATLAFESPILAIEKLVFSPTKEPKPTQNGNEQMTTNEIQTDIKSNGQASTQF